MFYRWTDVSEAFCLLKDIMSHLFLVGGNKVEISKYSRIYKVDGGYALFNTINKCIVKIEEPYIVDNYIVDDFPDEYFRALQDMGYFAHNQDVEKQVEALLEKDKKLIISVEVGLICNMRCPYCYQGTDKSSSKTLSEKDIEHLVKYYEKVAEIWDYQEIVLKVLGGEPTTIWDITNKVITSTIEYCKKNNKKINLMIDTNGVLVDPIMNLKGYDSLLLTIPLTNKKCHDRVRKLVNGQGSYDVIVANVNRIYEVNPDIKIVLRHNTDGENLMLFPEFIDDLKEKLLFPPIIDLSYTTELGDGGFKNPLKYTEYINWKSGDAIDILAQRDMIIMATPLMTFDRCQFRSKYSLKMFSDGTVGGCAMDFFKTDREKILDVCSELAQLEAMSNSFENNYEKCKSCKSFFLCGGGYNLPCMKSLHIKECDVDGAYVINIEQFIKKYLYYKSINKEKLFVGFNQNMVIR